MSDTLFFNKAEFSTTADYWQQYGLKQSPFDDIPQLAFYYPVPHWQSHLQYLQNFCRGNQPLMLIDGESGIGKSMFIAEFLTQLDSYVTPLQIKSKASVTSSQLLMQIAQEFHVAFPLNQTTQDQVPAIMQSLQRMQKICLLIVDDADLLPTETLTTLVQLATAQHSHNYLYLVLLSELNLQNTLENLAAAQQRSLPVPVLTLAALSLGETKQYLQHRLTRAGLIGKIPFTKSMIERIHELSSGVPGRINRVAQQMLLDLLKPSNERVSLRNTEMTFPWHKWLRLRWALPMVLLLGAAAVWQLERNNEELAAMKSLNPRLVLKDSVAKPITTAAMPTQPAANTNPIIVNNTALTPAVVAAPVAVSAPATATLQPQPPIQLQPQPMAATNPVANSINAMAPVAANNNVVATNAPVTDATTTDATITAEQAIKPNPIAAAKKMQGFALQLIGSYNANDLHRFRKQYQLSTQQVTQLRTERAGKAWYILLYGHYHSPQQAKAAMAELPKKLRGQRVWVRPLTPLSATSQG